LRVLKKLTPCRFKKRGVYYPFWNENRENRENRKTEKTEKQRKQEQDSAEIGKQTKVENGLN
jgi:hypothetical protein